MERPDLEAIETEWDRNKSAPWNNKVWGHVPALLAYIRHLESGAPALRESLATLYKQVKGDPDRVETAYHLGKAIQYLALAQDPNPIIPSSMVGATPEPIQGGAQA